jgi:hypothetical protein
MQTDAKDKSTEIGSPGFKPLDARAVGEPEAVRLRSPLAKIPAYKEFWASVESAQATAGLKSAAAKSESFEQTTG